ncbi:MAG: ABC transporter substrate-binding protein [Proteobacteria bacterium]|nr:ABC transporter substrate-binding protein [Pseudomonadota bacterium]MBI3499990.1 ABC transporter substrate-binding protein [Pseudomonadota bacterium]
MTIDRRTVLQGLTAMGAAGALARTGALAQTAPTPVVATFGPAGSIYAPNMVADVMGFAKEEGIDLKLQIPDGGAKARQILAAGEAQFGHGDTTHPLQISNRGRPARILMASETVCSYANIVVRKDLFDQGIDTVEKLGRWKRADGAKPIVAATAIGSGTWMYGSFIFERLGVGDNINWVAGGSTSTMLGGLKSKQFDAIMALPNWIYDAESHGWGKTIYNVLDKATWDKAFGGPMPTTVVYAQLSTIREKPEMVQAYMNAIYKSMQWLKTNSVDAILAKIGPKYLGDLNPESAKLEMGYYKAAWHYAGTISEAEYKTAAPVFFRDGTDIQPVAFADAVDARFLENARKKFG